jgi:hypothetical protein
MGVPPKPSVLIAFEGLFELYSRSNRLLPDPLKISFQNILPKRFLKTSPQSVFLKYPPKTSFENNFMHIVYSCIIDLHIINLSPIIYFTCTARETCKVIIVLIFRSTTKFLKIQDKYQVNKNQERVETYLFSYLFLHLLSHLPNILYFLRYNLSGVRSKIRAFSLFTVAVACYSC